MPTRAPALRSEVARAPSRQQRACELVLSLAARAAGIATLLLLAALLLQMLGQAWPAMQQLSLGFLASSAWDSRSGTYGVLPQIAGTLYTSLLALLLGGTLGVVMATVLTQGFLPHRLQGVARQLIELLAAIPSVTYGLWGTFVVIPAIAAPAHWLHQRLSFLPLFSTDLNGPGVLPSVLVLSIMIVPTVVALSAEALAAVPECLLTGAYSLGATRTEVIFRVALPMAASGIGGALVLGLGRAIGETVALAMLIGNANVFGWSLLSPGSTLTSLLASRFPQASALEAHALMYAALVLLALTLLVNALGSLIIARTTLRLRGLA